jgi:hypothetical protein
MVDLLSPFLSPIKQWIPPPPDLLRDTRDLSPRSLARLCGYAGPLIHTELSEMSVTPATSHQLASRKPSLHQWGDRCHFAMSHLWLKLAAARITEDPHLPSPCRFDHWEKSLSALSLCGWVENNYQ